jgi:DNA-binding NarL/FixJ family response regulator
VSKVDWIGLAERAYALEPSEEAWLRGVAEKIHGHLGNDFGTSAGIWEHGDDRSPTHLFSVYPDGSDHPRMTFGARVALAVLWPEDWLRALWRTDLVCTSGLEALGEEGYRGYRRYDERWSAQRVLERTGISWADWGIRDARRVLAVTPGGPRVLVLAPLRRAARTEPALRAHWARAMVHVAAGLRMRRRLARARAEDDGDAVLTLDGRLHHAEGEAKEPALADALREAAVRIDRARGKLRREDPEGALAMWQGLVEGRWSLLDRFERDGRHYLVARRNDPGFADPRALTKQERVVLGYAAVGWANKEIAYALGVAPSTVGTLLSRAMRKLSAGRVELASTPASELRVASLDGEIDVASFEVGEDAIPGELSPAEREIARLAMRGLSNETIASRRRTALRTVANQLASIYKKLGVASRAELAARVASARGAAHR